MAKRRDQKSFDGGPVGYGKPPAEHQFRKGGKKPEGSGRRKGSRNSRAIIEEMLSEEISINQAGKKKVITRRELLIRSGYEKAIKANSVRESLNLVNLFEKLAPESIDALPPIFVESIPGDEGL